MKFQTTRIIIFAAILVLAGIGWHYKSQIMPEGKRSVAVIPTPASTTSSVKKVEAVSDAKPINVCVVTWGGYAGGQYFNGGFAASKESRYFKDYGILVNFKLIDNYNASRDAWKADQCQLLWTTADSFPVEAGALATFDPVQIFQADWSRGGDAMVVRRDINQVADLRGKKIALVPGTPSNTLLIWALEAGGLEPSNIQTVTVEEVPKATEAFKAGAVDAAVVWSPDDEDIVQNVKGSKVLMSSRTAGSIIADTFYTKRSFLESHRQELSALVEGWLRGAAEINTDPAAKDAAIKILASGLNQPDDFVRKAIDNVRLTTYGDNVNFFNVNGSYQGVKGEDLYTKMGRVYTNLGLAKNVPAWRNVVDLGILRSIHLDGPANAAEGAAKFTAPTAADVEAPAIATKQLSVKFATGSAILDDNAKNVIDLGFGQLAKGFRSSRVRIEGNTDSVGSDQANQILSEKRAKAVADYLVQQYNFDANRFVVVGNGKSKPVADNTTEAGRAKNRRTDFQLLSGS